MPNDFLHVMKSSTAQAYERAEASASLHIVNSREDGHELRVPLATHVSLGDARTLRKLLESSDSTLALIADEARILGLGSVSPVAESLDIGVRGKLDWTLSAQGKALLQSAASQVSFPRVPLDRDDLVEAARRTVGACNLERIWEYVEAARSSGHGMMLAVSSKAEAEARRLGSEAFVLESCVLENSEIQRLGAVDGALLVGTEGRYQRVHSDSAFIVVVSVDGDPSLLPALRPQVSRSEVAPTIDEFCVICSQEHPDGEDFAEALRRVEKYAFYLDAEQCERVNRADEEEQMRRISEGGIGTRRPPYRPDPEMNDSYFLANGQDDQEGCSSELH